MHNEVQMGLHAHLKVFAEPMYTTDNTLEPVPYGVLDHRMVRIRLCILFYDLFAT